MSSYTPPDPISPWPQFNSLQFIISDQSVTRNYVDTTFLKLSGGTMLGTILAIDITMSSFLTLPLSKLVIGTTTVLTSGTELNYLSGLTLGTVTASKILAVDANKDIATINSLTTNTLICNTQFNNLGNATYSGTNSTINMTGSASRITISGANSDIYLSGGNAYINLLNTAASSNITTGSIRSAGGAYFGNDCVFNTQITIGSSVLNTTNAGYLTSISAGTVSASKCIVVDVNKDISSFRNLGYTGTLTSVTQNSSGIYTNSNSTDSSSVLTGSMILSGGLGCSKTITALTVNSTTLNTTGIITSSLATEATSNVNASCVFFGGVSIVKKLFISGNVQNTSTDTNAITAGSNAISTLGSIFSTKAYYNNSYYNCVTINSSASSHATSLQAICLNDQGIYFRGINNSDSNHGIMYSNNASWNSGSGFASANLDGPVLFGNLAVLIGTLTGGVETESCRFVGTKVTVSTTLQVGSTTSAQLLVGCTAMANPQVACNINGLGSHIRMSYNNSAGTETVFTGIGCSASGVCALNCTNGGVTNSFYFLSTGWLGLTATPRYELDMSVTTANCKICLYQSGSNGTYGLGATGGTMTYLSGSDGHRFYNSTNGALTTLLSTIDSTGLTCVGKGEFTSTLRTTGKNNPATGTGIELSYASSIGNILVYDRLNSVYKDLNLNDSAYISSAGLFGIGTTSPACNLHVVGTTNQSNPFSFGFLNSGGAGSSTGFTNRAFSIRSSGGILTDAGEIDTFSDIRMKYNVNDLDSKLCNKFIDNIQPISFKYTNRENDRVHYGFNAQELMKYGFTSLVGYSHDENPLLIESIVKCDDGNDITLSKNTRLVVTMLDMIPILMNVVKEQKKELNDLKSIVNNLVAVLTPGALKKFNSIE